MAKASPVPESFDIKAATKIAKKFGGGAAPREAPVPMGTATPESVPENVRQRAESAKQKYMRENNVDENLDPLPAPSFGPKPMSMSNVPSLEDDAAKANAAKAEKEARKQATQGGPR
jgi:hypothetical protein